ncbi:MAG: MFS transporter [Promethearchaeota archaeon]
MVKKTHTWKFWPVMCLAFMYPVNLSLISISIPIYYFNEKIPIEIIGIIASAIAITYSFSPILLDKLSQKFGRKKSVLIATLGASAAQISFFFTLEPVIFFIARLLEGFVMGFFWPNLQSTISDNPKDTQNKYAGKYNFSWNLGVMSGFLLGAIVVFFIDEIKSVFYFAALIMILTSVIAIFFFHEPSNMNSQTSSLDKYNLRDHVADSQDKNNFSKYSIPLIIPILLGTGYCILRASMTLLYPIKSEILGFQTYIVYIFFFFLFLAQTCSTTVSSFLTMKSLKRITLVSLGCVFFLTMTLGMITTTNIVVYIILFLLIGIFCGLIIGSTLKLFIALNVKNQTSKYSSIYATLIGVCFLFTPILVGFIAAIDLNLGFYAISIAILIIIIPASIFIRKIQKE